MQNHGARQELNEGQEEGKWIKRRSFPVLLTSPAFLPTHLYPPTPLLSSEASRRLLSNTWQAHIGGRRLVDAFRHLIGVFAETPHMCCGKYRQL